MVNEGLWMCKRCGAWLQPEKFSTAAQRQGSLWCDACWEARHARQRERRAVLKPVGMEDVDRRCRVCGAVKAVGEFDVGKAGRWPACKTCRRDFDIQNFNQVAAARMKYPELVKRAAERHWDGYCDWVDRMSTTRRWSTPKYSAMMKARSRYTEPVPFVEVEVVIDAELRAAGKALTIDEAAQAGAAAQEARPSDDSNP